MFGASVHSRQGAERKQRFFLQAHTKVYEDESVEKTMRSPEDQEYYLNLTSGDATFDFDVAAGNAWHWEEQKALASCAPPLFGGA